MCGCVLGGRRRPLSPNQNVSIRHCQAGWCRYQAGDNIVTQGESGLIRNRKIGSPWFFNRPNISLPSTDLAACGQTYDPASQSTGATTTRVRGQEFYLITSGTARVWVKSGDDEQEYVSWHQWSGVCSLWSFLGIQETLFLALT